MRKTVLMLGVLALAAPAGGAGSLTENERALPCEVNFQLRNDLNHSVTVNWEKSQVRTRIGWWTQLGSGSTGLLTGATRTISHQVKLGCSAHRRYRLFITSTQRGSVYHYLPSEKSFTQDNDLTVRLSDAF